MSSQAINLLARLEAERHERPDIADAFASLDPKLSSFDIQVDLLACAICEGKELTGHFDEYALMDARLLISGVIAAYAYRPDGAAPSLEAIRELICGAGFFAFCRAAMTQGPYVRARLAAYSLPYLDTSKTLHAIRATATTILDAHNRNKTKGRPALASNKL